MQTVGLLLLGSGWMESTPVVCLLVSQSGEKGWGGVVGVCVVWCRVPRVLWVPG